VVIVLTTTSPEAFDEETRSRFVQLTMDELAAQTKAYWNDSAAHSHSKARWNERLPKPCNDYITTRSDCRGRWQS
jgi:hypothetical protein